MHILPAHVYAKNDFGQSSLEPPVGSGPYRVSQVLPGRRIVYQRVADYWARDLPTRRGLHNFDHWIVDYYRDANAKAQAFMAKPYPHFTWRVENHRVELVRQVLESASPK